MVVGVIVFDVNKASGLVDTHSEFDASDRPNDHDGNPLKSPFFFADFYTPRALERSSELIRDTVCLVSKAFARHRSYRAAPTKNLGGAAFTNPGGGMGFNPLARFMKSPVAQAPRTVFREAKVGSSQNNEAAKLNTRQSLHQNGEQDAAVNVEPENGAVRISPSDFSSSSFGGLLESDQQRLDSTEFLLLWTVHGGAIGYCFIVKESDNLALAETCLGTLRMCLRAVLRDNNSTARNDPTQASIGAQSAGTVDYDLARTICADIKQRIAMRSAARASS
eukprot:INCI7180.1.p1 GENE.INCI7180.1~~INCI7180.1.p1  ORF type:complete len:278 (+),score=46.25 INCI7180.1:246-1079(+)